MSNTTAVKSTEKLEAVATKMAEILSEEGVLGGSDDRFINFEKGAFVHMVTKHTEDARHYLEVTYAGSCVRLIINMRETDGEFAITSIGAYDHPWDNPAINYTRLTERLVEAAGL